MAGQHDDAKLQQLTTASLARRQLIGQAIIDGLLTSGQASVLPLAADPDYNQGQGGYTQKGGDHKQGGGDYNQSPASLLGIEQVINDRINVIREVGIREVGPINP